MLITLDITLLGVLLPSIGKEFAISAGERSGHLSYYALVFGGLLLVAGKCADIVGQRACCLAGLGVVGLGTIVAATSMNFETRRSSWPSPAGDMICSHVITRPS